MLVRDLFDRYGPTVALGVLITLLVLMLPSNTKESEGVGVDTAGGDRAIDSATGSPIDVAGPDGTSATGSDAIDPATGKPVPGATDDGPQASATPPPAGADCRADGRQPGIYVDMPTCVPLFTGNNGGATARGVTADKIIVARYVPQEDAATNAALTAAGATDTPEKIKEEFEALRRYGNHHFETYGREVVFVDVHASGPSDNDAAMRADAVRIAEEVKAFAVLQGSSSGIVSEELAQRDVHVIRFTAFSRMFYETVPQRIWALLPTPEQYFINLAEYIGKRLAGRNAVHAGDDQDASLQQKFRQQKRKFGLIWIEGSGSRVDPYAKRLRDFFVQELAKYNVVLSADAAYTFDLPRQQQQATSMISKMRAAGVTSIAFYGDPLYPVFLTREATRQSYFPEWLITGTGLTDTSFFGRTYDQAQWQNAFGISPLQVFVKNVEETSGYREFHHMNEGAAKGDEGVAINVVRNDVIPLFIGIHGAGPNLTPETFRQGMLDFPRTGGIPTIPLVDYTELDPVQFQDFTEVWWNPSRSGKDEIGKDGVGVLMKADGGRRFEIGEWPASESAAFDEATSVFTEDPPPEWRFAHEDDGHRHDPTLPCRSCR